MRVLAFDASSTVGWAFFADARAVPVLGDFEVPNSTDYGVRCLDMLNRTRILVEHHKPDVVAFEAPIFLPRDRWHTRRLLTSLTVVIELVAAMRGLRCIEASPADVKRALAGARASKADMVVAATRMGWKVANDHQADACGVALAVYSHLRLRELVERRQGVAT